MSRKKTIKLEAGTQGTDRVWIGAPVECYDFVRKPISGKELHVLHFSVPQAEAVIEMLQGEIERVKGLAEDEDPSPVDLGPQKGPSSPAKVQAECKAVRKRLAEIKSKD